MTDDPDRLLHIFRKMVLSEVRSDRFDLTLRQMAVVLTVCGSDEPPTVRGLAKHLNIGKSPVTRALNVLSNLDLTHCEVDPRNGRSVHIVQAEAGVAMIRRLAEAMASTANDH